MSRKFMLIPILLLPLLTLNNQCKTKLDPIPSKINILAFNIWQEGASVPNGLEKIRDIIVKTNPDLVGFTEVRNYNNADWTTKIIQELSAAGLQYRRGYAGGDVSLISKYPIRSSSMIYKGKGSIARFDLNINEHPFIVAVAHLDYTHYACYLPRGYNGGRPDWNMIDDGKGNPAPVTDVNQILAYNLSSARDEQIKAFINAADSISAPVILMGDFNEPSHLDWTASNASLFDHNGLVIPWQTTLTLVNNGFKDAYREYFPDETKNPGITWPSYANEIESTSWTPKADERDRIDYIFYKGPSVQTSYAALVGPKASYVYNQIDSSHTSNEHYMAETLSWPSDHKAVFVTLSVGHK